MSPRAAFWSTTTFVVSGSFLPLAISDSRRSTRKMMSMSLTSCASDYGTRRCGSRASMTPHERPNARRSASCAGAGTIVETSPPNEAISLTRLELT
jgi:hypothetical protein